MDPGKDLVATKVFTSLNKIGFEVCSVELTSETRSLDDFDDLSLGLAYRPMGRGGGGRSEQQN